MQGAAAYVGGDLAAKLTNEPAHFSWAGLVATSLASAVSGKLGPTGADRQIGNQASSAWDTAAATAVGGATDKVVSQALGDHHVQSWDQLAENVAGSALGSPIGQAALTPISQAIQSYQQQQLQVAEAALGARAVAVAATTSARIDAQLDPR